MFSSKSEARRYAKSRILALTPQEKSLLDEGIYKNTLQILRSQTLPGDAILSFSSDQWEPNLRGLEKDCPSLDFYYPRVVNEKEMEFLYPEGWRVGSYGLDEPLGERKIESLSGFRWVLLPSLGFSKSGARLGRGKGYYDRAMENFPREKALGISYDFLVGVEFPDETHDFRPKFVITEKAMRCF